MPSTDQTTTFQSILDSKLASIPASARSKSPAGPDGRSRSSSRSAVGKGKGKGRDKEAEEEEEFLREAYRIHNHITSLSQLLSTVRKAYLSTAEPSASSRVRRARPDSHEAQEGGGDEGEADERDEWRKWEKVKYLSDRERDEIDLRARMILRRCKDRVGVLELAEQARKSKTPSIAHPSTLLSFLPSLQSIASSSALASSSSFVPLIAAHRASILWTLNDYLARITNVVGGMQEERSKRREERSTTLGGKAAAEAAIMNRQAHAQTQAQTGFGAGLGFGGQGNNNGPGGGRKIPDGMIVGVDDPAFTFGADAHLRQKGSGLETRGQAEAGVGAGAGAGIGIIDPSSPPIESLLSPTQIQAFENENNVLLENMSTTLSSVLSAESSLLEISQLQSELVRHLTQQTEMIDLLYEDAVGNVAQISGANKQLVQAKERGMESRMFLLIFLVGASLALLFLDWYAA